MFITSTSLTPPPPPPPTPCFPIGLVKARSDFIVRSAETGLGRRMLVIAVISVDAYPFLAFSDLTVTFRIQE